MKLPSTIACAIKSGPVPEVRDWRGLAVEKLTRAERAMRFVERFLIVPEGDLVGQPVALALFQEVFFYAVYDNPAGTKRAYLSIARKNAKTATIAMIALVHIVGPEARQNSRIQSGARSREQAAEVYNYASKMAALSPKLGERMVRPTPSNKKLTGIRMNVEYRAIAADGKRAHGGSPIVAILDEVGQVKGSQDDFVDAITTSQGAYDDAMLFAISTQSPTDADLFSIWLDGAEVAGNPSIVSHVYTAPEDCELNDHAAWAAANPALGLFRSRRDLEEQAKYAETPTQEATFRVLCLNQRVNMTAPLVSPKVWKDGNAEPAAWDGGPIYGGLDLSFTTDLTAFVLVQRQNGVLMVRPHFWMPQAKVAEATKRDRAPYDVWVKQELIRTTPGPVIDYDYVAADVGRICAGLAVARIGFDDWRMDRLEAALQRVGITLPLENFRQGFKSMTPAIDALEEDLLKRQVHHGGNGPLGMCARNAVVIPDPAGNRKLDKSKATGRIDGMVALVMARGVEAMLAEPDNGPPMLLII